MKTPIAVALLATLAGCASRPMYRSVGNYAPAPEGTTRGSSQDQANTNDAVATLFEHLFVTILHDKEAVGTLGGQCRIRGEKASNIEVPCGNLAIVLRDEKGSELGRAILDEAKFQFAVSPGKRYRLSLHSTKYALSREAQGPFVAGDDVRIELATVTRQQ